MRGWGSTNTWLNWDSYTSDCRRQTRHDPCGEWRPVAGKNNASNIRTLKPKFDMETDLTNHLRWRLGNLLVVCSGLIGLVPRLHGIAHLGSFYGFGSCACGVCSPPFWPFFVCIGGRPATNSWGYITHHPCYFLHTRNLHNVAYTPQYGAIG